LKNISSSSQAKKTDLNLVRNTAPGTGVSHPGEVATYLPSAAPFRYASHSAAKGAHTLLRKKIYNLIALEADYRQVNAMGAELVALGKELNRQHLQHVRGLGELTFSEDEEEIDWVRTVNAHHKECRLRPHMTLITLDAAYRYITKVKGTLQQGASTGSPTTLWATASSQNPSPSNTVVNAAQQQLTSKPNEVARCQKAKSHCSSSHSLTSCLRSRTSTKQSLAFLQQEEARLAEEDEEETELEQQEAEL